MRVYSFVFVTFTSRLDNTKLNLIHVRLYNCTAIINYKKMFLKIVLCSKINHTLKMRPLDFLLTTVENLI